MKLMIQINNEKNVVKFIKKNLEKEFDYKIDEIGDEFSDCSEHANEKLKECVYFNCTFISNERELKVNRMLQNNFYNKFCVIPLGDSCTDCGNCKDTNGEALFYKPRYCSA